MLKQNFTAAPVLVHYDLHAPCTLVTDAPDFALAAVLWQPDADGNLHPVAFYSCKFSPAEINYEVHDKKLLAIVECLHGMCAWLLGSPFPISVISDHKNLEFFMSSQVLNHRQARWVMFLSDFNFHLVWKPGSRNVADAPSRRLDFIPQKGDDTLLVQNQHILTPKHTQFLFPSQNPPDDMHSISNLSAITTLFIDTSDLLQRFKTALQVDTQWHEALIQGSEDFM